MFKMTGLMKCYCTNSLHWFCRMYWDSV